jgi:hypothetical protein
MVLFNKQYFNVFLMLKALKPYIFSQSDVEFADIELKNVDIQTDNGSEFGAKKRDINTPGFVNTIMMEFGAQHTYIPPGCSNANADVESFHATIESEFFDLESFESKKDFFRKAQAYQYFYNFVRPNFSKEGKTPLQIVLEDRPEISPAVLNFPVYDLDELFRQKMEILGGHYVHKLPEIFGNKKKNPYFR